MGFGASKRSQTTELWRGGSEQTEVGPEEGHWCGRGGRDEFDPEDALDDGSADTLRRVATVESKERDMLNKEFNTGNSLLEKTSIASILQDTDNNSGIRDVQPINKNEIIPAFPTYDPSEEELMASIEKILEEQR